MKGTLPGTQILAAAAPLMRTIPVGYWSGSSGDYYITIQATNVTANSMLKLYWDKTSNDMLKGPMWCTHSAGQIQIHTSAIPSGTVTIGVELIGTVGEAQYIDLPDVYSKSQVDSIVSQSTATVSGTFTGSSNISANATTCSKSGNMGIVSINVTMAAIGTQSSWCSVGTISMHPAQQTYGVVTDDSGAKSCRILTTGEIDVWRPVAGTQYIGNVSFTL